MVLGHLTLDAPIAKSDVAVYGAAREHARRFKVNVGDRGCQIFVGKVSGAESLPVLCDRSICVRWTNQDFWSVQLVAHREGVRWGSVIAILGPNTHRQTELLQVVDALNGQGSLSGF